MKKFAVAAVMPLVLLATPALAQDADGSMGGVKAGALVGVDSVQFKYDGESESESDVGYGVTLGYDFDTGNAVFGVEGEFSDSGVGISYTDVLAAGDEVSLVAGRDLYIGARAGFKAGPTSLIYVKGGYTSARAKGTYDDGTTSESISDSLDGYRIGAGLEQRVGPNLSVRAEYRYSDYGEYSYAGYATGLSVSRHQGMVGLIGRF